MELKHFCEAHGFAPSKEVHVETEVDIDPYGIDWRVSLVDSEPILLPQINFEANHFSRLDHIDVIRSMERLEQTHFQVLLMEYDKNYSDKLSLEEYAVGTMSHEFYLLGSFPKKYKDDFLEAYQGNETKILPPAARRFYNIIKSMTDATAEISLRTYGGATVASMVLSEARLVDILGGLHSSGFSQYYSDRFTPTPLVLNTMNKYKHDHSVSHLDKCKKYFATLPSTSDNNTNTSYPFYFGNYWVNSTIQKGKVVPKLKIRGTCVNQVDWREAILFLLPSNCYCVFGNPASFATVSGYYVGKLLLSSLYDECLQHFIDKNT